jgi:hypothetical protein
VMSYCGFHLHFSDDLWQMNIFSHTSLEFLWLLLKNVYLDLLPIFSWFSLCFAVEFLVLLSMFLYQMHIYCHLILLSDAQFTDVFSHSVSCFCTLIVCIAVQKLQKLSSFLEPHLSTFVYFAFRVIHKNTWSIPMTWRILFVIFY